MKPEDVPDELVDLAMATELALREQHRPEHQDLQRFRSQNPATAAMHETAVRHLLAAVLPAHERQVRERVAAELVRAFSPLEPTDDYDKGVLDAAMVVRARAPEGQRPLTREEILAALDQPEETR